MTVNNTQMTTNGWNANAVSADSTFTSQNPNMTTGNGFIDPQVLTAMVSAQLPNNLVFAPLATVDNTLVGRPGDTISVPRWKYMGEAKDVKEGGQVPFNTLTATMQNITVKKAAAGAIITDEMLASAYGSPLDEVTHQLSMGMADHIDNDAMNTLLKAPMTVSNGADLSLINAITAKFIENTTVGNDTTEKEAMLSGVIVLNPEDANTLIANATETYTRPTALGDNVLVSGNGALGEILGWQIVTARKLKKGQGIAMKTGALGIYMKKALSVETQRDIDHFATKIVTSEMYATAINDDAKVIALTLTAPSTTTSAAK